MEEYRDVHSNRDLVGYYIKIIEKSSMSLKQKGNIKRFIEDMRIGKAGSKKVKDRRIAAYLQFLMRSHEYFKKDLDILTEKETTQFYKDLQENKIKKKNGMPYSDFSKTDFVKALKRYLGWCWGRESKEYGNKLRWMKEYSNKSNKKAINLEDCKKVVNEEKSKRNKALFYFLFDSGARIEECLNVKIGDLQTSGKDSKSSYYIVHLRGQKTEDSDRTIPIPLCKKELNEWLQDHPTGEDSDFLFPINYDNARKIIRIMSKKVLKFALKPHELRHSSATHYIQFGGYGADNIGGFYYRYGWKFGSDEARTYIKTHLYGGQLGHEKVVKAITSDKIDEMAKRITCLESDLNKLYEHNKVFVKTFEHLASNKVNPKDKIFLLKEMSKKFCSLKEGESLELKE